MEAILDDGETHALALCRKLGKNIFLTDDLDARETGTSLGLEVHGSVGIIARAYKQGLIDLTEAKAALEDLYNVSDLQPHTGCDRGLFIHPVTALLP